MGLEHLSNYCVILKKCDENLMVKRVHKNEELHEMVEQFDLSSLFNLLEAIEVESVQSSLSKITSLNLSHCELTDLPRALNLPNMKELNLSHNKLSMVPLCLYGNGLNKLESLDLSYNLITNFDVEPDCVLCLKVLLLNNNAFMNIPPWFLTFRCIRLETLNYSENRAQHYNFLSHNCNFSIMHLCKLELRNSCLVDSDLMWLKCFKSLQSLDISNNTLLPDRKYVNKFKELERLFFKPRWKELKTLKLTYLDISFFPEGIFWLESLTELVISNNLLSWFPDGIEFLVNLELLDVSNNNLITIPKQISELVKLKALIASENFLDEVPFGPNSLEVLDLYDNNIHVIKPANFNIVKYVDLDYNYVCLQDQTFDYETYCLKRDQFRDFYNLENRRCDFKVLEETCSMSEQSSSDSSEGYSCDNTNELNNFTACPQEFEEEDWDRDCVNNYCVYKHPDITLSDNEYNGESALIFSEKINKQYCFYVDDEDWMFVDAD